MGRTGTEASHGAAGRTTGGKPGARRLRRDEDGGTQRGQLRGAARGESRARGGTGREDGEERAGPGPDGAGRGGGGRGRGRAEPPPGAQ